MPRTASLARFLKPETNFLTAIALGCILFGLVLFGRHYFSVKQIEVQSNTSSQTLLGIEEFKESNLIFLRENEVSEKILIRNPYLSKVIVSKVYPHTLKLFIRFSEPAGALLVDEGIFLLDAQGRILQKLKTASVKEYAKINYYQKLQYSSYQAGDRVDYEDILTALHYILLLNDFGREVLSVDIAGEDMVALQMKTNKILVSAEKDRVQQDYQLMTLIRQFKITGGEFRLLDLRFDKPVVTLE